MSEDINRDGVRQGKGKIDLRSYQPLRDGVLLKRIQQEIISPIIVPDIARKPTHAGLVVAVGPGRLTTEDVRIPCTVTKGDIVWYQTSDFDDGEYVLIQEADILGIVSEA